MGTLESRRTWKRAEDGVDGEVETKRLMKFLRIL